MSEQPENSYDFAGFRFDGNRRRLLRGDEPVLLSPKATELLVLLLSREGKFVTKEEIFSAVWPDTFVEDGVLTQNIYTLRKALGTDADGKSLVETKSRLGYRISVPVTMVNEKAKSTTFVVEPIRANTDPTIAPTATTPKFVFPLLILLFAAVAIFIAYRFLLVETTETVSRLDRVRIQQITDSADITYSTLSPDGNFVAFARVSGISVKNLATNEETKLDIPNVKRFGHMQFSADSASILLRNRASSLIPSDILKVSRFGGEATKLADNVWSGFSLSPDDKLLVFARTVPAENRHALVLKDLAAGTETEILNAIAPEEFRLRSHPAWSPDGSRIAVIFERQGKGFDRIVIFDRRTGATDSLEFKNFNQVDQVIWLPKKNALLASARETKFYQLWEIAVESRRLARVTNDLNIYLSPAISSDGKKLLTTQNNFYTNLWNLNSAKPSEETEITSGKSNRDGFNGLDHFPNGDIVYNTNEGDSGDGNLWRIGAAGGEKKQLTGNAGKRNENPVVAPDGKSIYFTSDRGGRMAIWQIDADGNNPRQLTAPENGGDQFPQVSPDGQWLYFIRRTGKVSVVVRKSLVDNSETAIEETAKLSPTSFLALTPDGKKIAFHSLTEKIQSDNIQQNHQIAVISLDSPQNVSFYSMGGRKPEIFWTPSSDGFYTIAPLPGVDEIRLNSLLPGQRPTTIASFPKLELYSLAIHGQTMTIARGRQQNDAVLLTNFE